MLKFLLLFILVVATFAQSIVSGQNSSCVDKTGDLCWFYSDDQCVGQYEGWARRECPYRCGYCIESPPCVDLIDNCDDYPDGLCTDPFYGAFVREKCRKYCNKCTYPGKINTTEATSVSTSAQNLTTHVSDCMDDPHRDCWTISESNCIGKYTPWARKHCPYRCGYCEEIPPCIDLANNCDEYGDDLCTNDFYGEFARKNCRKYCRLCYQQTTSQYTNAMAIISTILHGNSTEGLESTAGQISQTAGIMTSADIPLSTADFSSNPFYTTDTGKNNQAIKTTSENHMISTTTSSSTTSVGTDGIVCEDKLHNCAAYGNDLCLNDLYGDFAKTFCRKFCLQCPGGNNKTVTEPIETNSCVDKQRNCDAYGDDLCTSTMYADFASKYCRKYCNKCNS